MITDPQISPTLSVIVPIYDDYSRLCHCLTALAGQQVEEPFEVLVIDNGTPSHRRLDIEQRFGFAKMFEQPNGGSYAARNVGLTHARGKFVAFTDADCIPAKDWLHAGLTLLRQNPKVGLIAGAIDVFASSPAHASWVETYEVEKAFPQREFVREYHFAATANAFTRREVVEEVGGFDSSLYSGGDREFGNRVAASGWSLLYSDWPRIRHPARKSLREMTSKMKRVAKGLHELHFGSSAPPLQYAQALAQLARKSAPPLRYTCEISSDSHRTALERTALISVHWYKIMGTRAIQWKLVLGDLFSRSD